MSDLQLHRVDKADTEIVATRLEAPRGDRSWVDHANEAEAWERQHEAEWTRVDRKLRDIAARRAALDAEEANLLRYAEELKLWRGWGFASMLEYMERAMGYAPHTAAERLRVARAIAELPLTAEALEQGALAHSAVRELSRVAVPDTEAAWLEAAQGKSLREIEAMVSGHKPGDLPTDETEPRLHRRKLALEVSPETYDLWRKLHALAAEEHGQRLSDDELIQSLFRRAYGDGSVGRGDGNTGHGAVGNLSASSRANSAGSPAYKIAIKQCPDCKRAWQYSGGRDIEIDPAVAECAACDAVHLGSLDAAEPERATTTVTSRKREQVLARDGHCCSVPGCRRNVGLDLHHMEYQSHGGGHELSNLTTICDLHHRAIHYGKLVIRGSAPGGLGFEFRKPRDRLNVTDDDGPARPAPPAPHPSADASSSFARTASAAESARSSALKGEGEPWRANGTLVPAAPTWETAMSAPTASSLALKGESEPWRADDTPVPQTPTWETAVTAPTAGLSALDGESEPRCADDMPVPQTPTWETAMSAPTDGSSALDGDSEPRRTDGSPMADGPAWATAVTAPTAGSSIMDSERGPRRTDGSLVAAEPTWATTASAPRPGSSAGECEREPRRTDGSRSPSAAGPVCARFASHDELKLSTCGHLDGHGGVEPSECPHRSGPARDS